MGDPLGDLWVFGYGSLMWRPGFSFEEAFVGRLEGFHRSLCIFSHIHRGTPDRPGLVLGLDEGGHSVGMAFRIADDQRDGVIAYLREREQTNMVYKEQTGRVTLLDGPKGSCQSAKGSVGEAVDALIFVADHRHRQYSGKLGLEEQLRFVRQGVGQSGPNADYVLNTAEHLKEIEIDDPELFALAERLRDV